MDPEEVQHDQVHDQVIAEDAISAARSDEEPQEWRRVSDEPEMWRKDGSTLAAWSPGMDEAPADPRFETSGEEPVTIVHPALATARVPKPMVSQRREACSHCGGIGFMPGISDYLRESAALLGDQGDEVIRAFYSRLFATAPAVATLFPGNPTQGDLGSDHRGAKQREKLLGAIVALSDLYDPDDAEKMGKLDTALKSFGRSHAAFARPDGTVRGSTWEEYAAVKDALFATLVQATGNAWKPEYTESWGQAYDYAAAVMIAEQHRSGFAAPRFPRA